MFETINRFLCPFSLGAICLFSVTMVFAGFTKLNSDQRSLEYNDEYINRILENELDTLHYINTYIDKDGNGMPDDLENGEDGIYKIIIDNQKSIEQISIDLCRINTKLDELTTSRKKK